jgi:Family of unknown function (DUF5677)
MWFKRDRVSFDEDFYAGAQLAAEKAASLGLSDADAEKFVNEVRDKALEAHVPVLVAALRKNMPSMLRRKRRQYRRFERWLHRYWGPALDLFYVVVVSAEEVGRKLVNDDARSAELEGDPVLSAIAGLHARACRTAFEVHRLLSGGFSMGALARCRTLHELAVVSSILVDHARLPDSSDLAERYLRHDAILAYKDLLAFQHIASSDGGDDQFTEEEVAVMRAERDRLVGKYGQSYLRDNGWAACLFGNRNPTFMELEKLAGLDHLRSHYKWASHEVHADASGWRLNQVDGGDYTFMSTGYTHEGISDPGTMALSSLLVTTVSLIFCREEIAPVDVMSAQTIVGLVSEAETAFSRGAESIDDLRKGS